MEMDMKKGTGIGLALIAVSAVLGIWMFFGSHSKADTNADGFTVTDGVLTDYTGTRQDVTIPDNVNEIAKSAFRNNSAIVSVAIPSGVKKIDGGAFQNCENLTGVSIGKGVSSIPANCFDGDENLSSVTLSEGLKTIGSGAFNNTAITSINIPASVSEIATDAFSNTALTNFNVADSSNYYASKDGLLYNKSMKTLIIVPSGVDGTVDVASGTSIIGTGSMINNRNITGISIPDSVEEIQKNALSGTGIKSITFKNKNIKIDDQGNWPSDGGQLEIWGYEGSTAQKYQMTHTNRNIIFRTLGSSDTPEPKPETKYYNVTFNANGGENTFNKTVRVEDGKTVVSPGTPKRDGYTFIAWYKDDKAYDFSTPVKSDMVLKAVWVGNSKIVNDNNGNNGNSGNGKSGNDNEFIRNSDGSIKTPDGLTVSSGTVKDASGKVLQTNTNTNALDQTPKTAGPMDSRYFLCLSIMLAGLSLILFSRSNKMKYVSARRKR
jgi:uncharacterized repeat protein (TIGR02543 family)